MKTMMVDPVMSMRLWSDFCRMGFEAQYVMAVRMAGLCGMIPQRRGENFRMVAEKGDAARESVGAALRSAATATELLAKSLSRRHACKRQP